MKKKWIAKLNSRTGDSIAEVLVALLISALGLVILASMIISSTRMISSSRDKMERYYEANNILESQSGESSASGAVWIWHVSEEDTSSAVKFHVSQTNNSIPLEFFMNDSLGNISIEAYKKKE